MSLTKQPITSQEIMTESGVDVDYSYDLMPGASPPEGAWQSVRLEGALLKRAHLEGASSREICGRARLEGVDLRGTVGLTQEQLESVSKRDQTV